MTTVAETRIVRAVVKYFIVIVMRIKGYSDERYSMLREGLSRGRSIGGLIGGWRIKGLTLLNR